MAEYNKVNVKLSDSQLNKSTVKNQTGVTWRMNIKIFEGNNLPQELLLATRQKNKLRNAFENNMSTDIKLSKTQISKIIQSGGSLGSLLSKIAGPLMKVTVPIAKKILALLGITAAVSAIDIGIQKKTHSSGTTMPIISVKKLMTQWELFKLLKILIFLWKETIENEIKEKKGEF